MAGLTREQRAERAKKQNRVPIGAQNKLAFEGLDENYHYHVVNDRPGRVAAFQRAGYEFDTEATRDTFGSVTETGQIGANTSLDLGLGDKGYLMRIRKELYEEDQAAKVQQVKDIENSMKRKPTKDNPYRGLTDE